MNDLDYAYRPGAIQRLASELADETGRDCKGRRHRRKKTQHPVLSEVILENTPRYEPVSSTDLYLRVVADYGSVDKRVFYRRMQWLRASGDVVVAERAKTGLYDQLFYVKAKAVSPSK